MCLKMNSGSPAIEEESRDRTSSRSSRRSSVECSRSRSPFSRRPTGPGQNTRPTTAARWSARFSTGSSRSILAASTACTVSGICTSAMVDAARHRCPSRTITPSSIRWRTISSRKNGLPSARSRIRPCTDDGRSATDSSSPTSRSDSNAVSGSRPTDETLRLPPPSRDVARSVPDAQDRSRTSARRPALRAPPTGRATPDRPNGCHRSPRRPALGPRAKRTTNATLRGS